MDAASISVSLIRSHAGKTLTSACVTVHSRVRYESTCLFKMSLNVNNQLKTRLEWSRDILSHTTVSCSVAQKRVKEQKVFSLDEKGPFVFLESPRGCLGPTVASSERL